MKIRTDVVKMYKEIHGWVGIISGLALFIAFYAGSLTMFEEQIQRWSSPPAALAAAPSLDETPDLVAKALAAHPEAAKGYEINLNVDTARPARISWEAGEERSEHGDALKNYASLADDGSLQVVSEGPSPVAQFIDVLHQQVGLSIEHEVAMPIMGAISLLYFVAIISGIIVLLPSLVKDLFAMRTGKNVKRMWLDTHNLLGIFSLPFHIIMALTAVVFAFHDQFYDAQGVAFGGTGRGDRPAAEAKGPKPELLPPAAIVASLKEQAPGFTPYTLSYSERGGKTGLRVMGGDPRYALRAPTYGVVMVDPVTGKIKEKDYMPALQDNWSATVTSFFALHFGNFGGAPIRWAYFLLGLAGAFIFYTGNLLWIESRRKRERKSGAVEQTKATRILAALTVGVPLGSIAGISVTLASSKAFGLGATEAMHSLVYHIIFFGFVIWALVKGAAKSGYAMSMATAASMLTIPLASLIFMGNHPPILLGIDATAVILAIGLVIVANATRNRANAAPRDSVWSKAGQEDKPESAFAQPA